VAGRRRDPTTLAEGVAAWRAHHTADGAMPAVDDISHASAGWANETLLVRFSWLRAGTDHELTERLVLRLPPLEPTFPVYDLAGQAAVHRAVAAAGVPAPVPATVEADPSWLGAPFMAMPFVEGHVAGEVPVFDEFVTGAPEAQQRAMVEAFVDVLARLHALDVAGSGLGAVLRGAEGGIAAELDWWERYLWWSVEQWSAEPLPVLLEALAWCRAHLDDAGLPRSLLWGDPRLGNVVFDDARRVVAVLDWELASIGPAEADLGWYLAQERTMAELIGLTVPGFPSRAEVLERYAAAAGRTPRDMAAFEVFGSFRQLAIDVRQARLAREVGAPYNTPFDETNPICGVLRRCMEDAGR
jgi:aminoglycoside phosphotransferase (APT) family kinase protein